MDTAGQPGNSPVYLPDTNLQAGSFMQYRISVDISVSDIQFVLMDKLAFHTKELPI